MAFKAGRWRNLLLGLVMLPVLHLVPPAHDRMEDDPRPWAVRRSGSSTRSTSTGLTDAINMTENGRFLNTPQAVIGGLAYNFVPFMILPIYVALEKIDVRLLDAARDLYDVPANAFRKIVLPLSLPGVFAGTLLTFIPAAGDYINAELLGNVNTGMIGSQINKLFIAESNYPAAAALSFIFMAIITAGVLLYARVLGTDELQA